MSLQPLKSIEEEHSTVQNNVKCPYCPNNFENNMTLQVFKLHVKKVHRISCVDNFTCPKCLQPIFDPTNRDADHNAEENVDHNIINRGSIMKTRKVLSLVK